MGDKGSFWMPESASSLSGEVDALFYLTYWISFVILGAVAVAIAYFAIRYRRRSESYIPPTTKDARILELASIIFPTILVLIVFTWGFKVYLKLNIAPPASYEIQVTASQWKWDFGYPDGTVYAGDLHVPANRPVRLVMNSLDVLHSFFVPQFRIKQDVVPNRYTSVWFEASRADTFDIFCTEYCGAQHSAMLGKVIALPQAEFDEWLAGAGGGGLSPEVYGERLFGQNTCNACHSIDGSRLIGPTMLGLFGSDRALESGESVLADENYLRQSIVAPAEQIAAGFPNQMPPSFGSLPPEQINALIAYIRTLQ